MPPAGFELSMLSCPKLLWLFWKLETVWLPKTVCDTHDPLCVPLRVSYRLIPRWPFPGEHSLR